MTSDQETELFMETIRSAVTAPNREQIVYTISLVEEVETQNANRLYLIQILCATNRAIYPIMVNSELTSGWENFLTKHGIILCKSGTIFGTSTFSS